MGDLAVVAIGPLVDGQKALVGVEGEVLAVVVGKKVGVVAVADDEQLHEAEQGVGVAVAGVVLVIDDLLHGAPGVNPGTLQLDLYQRQAIDQQEHVIAVMAAVGIDAQLVNDLELVLAPVFEVDQHVMQGGAVLTLKIAVFPQGPGGLEDIRADDLVPQPGKLGIRELDLVERFKLLAKVLHQRGLVADVGAITVFKVVKLFDQMALKFAFFIGTSGACSL